MVGILYLVVSPLYLIVGAKTAVAKYLLGGAKLPTPAQRGEKASLHIASTKQVSLCAAKCIKTGPIAINEYNVKEYFILSHRDIAMFKENEQK